MTASSGPSPTTTLAHGHADLARLWAQKEAKRADGGWWSLSGFSIQATIAFERFVRRLLIDREAGLVAFETVSDLMEVGGKVRLTQVKRTLTQQSLASAVLEACKIVALCTPAFARTLEFQVLCERDDAGIEPKDLALTAIFKDAPPDLASHRLVIAQFNKSEPVKVMSSPGLTLRRTLLSAGVRNPDKVARDALGMLFDAFDGQNREGVEKALYRAIGHIEAHARPEDSTPGRLLAPDRFQRTRSERRGLLTRARPRLTDLVGNRFLERPHLLGPVEDAAGAWLSSLEESYERDDVQLPILWLEGRSGDGKSVLTLQLVEALVARRERLASVVELESSEELLAWLRSAAPWDTPVSDQAEIGFIDDLAARMDSADFDPLIDQAFYRGSAYVGLITCGTPESRQAFAKLRHVVLTPVRIPAPTAADYEALRAWAETRLQRPVAASDPGGSSISQFMVGLSLQAHEPVARSYRPSPNIRAAMAVNALGLPAPASLARDEEVEAFVQAWSGVDLSPAVDSDGVRLAHAEAIWLLYAETVGLDGLAQAWGSDLGKVLAVRLEAGETTAARTLLGSLMNSRAHIARVRRAGCEAEDSAVLDAAFRAVSAAGPPELRAPLFRLWLPALIGRGLKGVELDALREEGRLLVTNPAIDPEVRSEVAATLLLVGRRSDGAERAAASYLRKAGPGQAASKFAATALSGRYGPELVAVAMSWLRQNTEAVEIGPLLSQVVAKGASADLQEIALGYVRRHLKEPASGPVLRALSLLQPTAAFDRVRDDWLRTCADPRSALAIYRDQLQSRDWRRYAAGALGFVQAHPDERGQQELLAILLRRRRQDPAVLKAARSWLDGQAGDGSVTPVLMEIIASRDPVAEDLRRAIHHIDALAPGYKTLFGTVSVVLNRLPAGTRAALRNGLPHSSTYTFDSAVRWKPNLSGHLETLDRRLRAESPERPPSRRRKGRK